MNEASSCFMFMKQRRRNGYLLQSNTHTSDACSATFLTTKAPMNHPQFKFILFVSLIMHIRAFSSIFTTPRILSRSPFKVASSALHLDASSSNTDSSGNSVTGNIYNVVNGERDDYPIVQLYTKEGCTLCDKVSDVLKSLREDHPHSLEAVDITDDDKTDVFDKYKWDIPVLHISGKYWTKHKLDAQEAKDALSSATNGEFEEQSGEPDAAAMERKMAERKTEK